MSSFLSPAFAPVSERTTASTDTLYDKSETSVTALADGGFVVVWVSDGQDSSEKGIFAQLFDASGTRVGEEFQVNSHTSGDQWQPAVASFDSGGFVVTWTSEDQDGSEGGIYSQRFDASGEKVGGETRVSSATVLDQSAPDVVTLPDGSYMIAWQAEDAANDRAIYAQAFDTNGEKFGLRRLVSDSDLRGNPDDTARHAVLEVLDSGEIVVGWASENVPAFRVFDSLTGELASVFYGEQVGTLSSGFGTTEGVDIVALSGGRFMSIWEQHHYSYRGPGAGPTTSADPLYGMTFSSDGVSEGPRTYLFTSDLPDFFYDEEYGHVSYFRTDYSFISSEYYYAPDRVVGGTLNNADWVELAIADASGPSVAQLSDGRILVGWKKYSSADIEIQFFSGNGATTGSLSVEGDVRLGGVLSAVVEGIADPDGIVSQSYQWTRNGVDIVGQTGASYTLTEDDIGVHVGVSMTVTDEKGNEATGTAIHPVALGGHFAGSEADDSITGTIGSDLIEGFGGNDTLDGGAFGFDTVSGGDGNDAISGGGLKSVTAGNGDDTVSGSTNYGEIHGDDGNDNLDIQGTGNQILGDAGNDTLRGADGSVISGGDGNDVLFGTAGTTILGGLGQDEIVAQGGGNVINPGDGQDTIFLTAGDYDGDLVRGSAADLTSDFLSGFNASHAVLIKNATLTGEATFALVEGNTRIVLATGPGPEDSFSLLLEGDLTGLGIEAFQRGGDIAIGVRSFPEGGLGQVRGNIFANSFVNTRANVVYAGGGDDLIITSDYGASSLFGEDGDDTISSGPASEMLDGGTGNDSLAGNGGDDTLQGGDGNDTANGGDGDDLIAGGIGDDLSFGGNGADRLYGGEGNDTLYGEPDNDTLTGGTGDDSIVGGLGDDEAFGEDGADTLDGGFGHDRLLGGAGDDSLDGGLGSDTLNGGDGDDTIIGGPGEDDLRDVIYAGDGNDSVDAGAGNDLIFGQDGNDTIAGGAGVDELQGQDGDDVITGSAFSDLVFGGAGDDFVNGGYGSDRINGGTGADKFFHVGIEGHGSDWVQDYSVTEGDVLLFGNSSATREQFRVNFAHTENAEGERSGDDAVMEAFVIFRPTGQIMWALVDGAGQDGINLKIGDDVFDLLG